ncbi:glycosyltransferase family 39 protein [Bacillus mycoides]|uniref:glycosyltransferase family 39 protein n=1 Tax=Bacillus mycoides TaxID=1405 RepID=UPI003D1A747F
MSAFLKGLSSFSTRTIYMIYSIFAITLIVSYFTDFQQENYVVILCGFLFLCSIGVVILRKGSSYLEKYNEKSVFLVLLLLCLGIKLSWVLVYRIQPLVDYATFYYTAEALSKDFVINSRYVALFPHIFGYSSFLSIFLKIFGSSYMIPPILNVVLTTICMGLIYFICRRIAGVKAAIIASVLWILLPSQTIYNMFAMSEPLYCAELLLIWAIIIIVHDKFLNINMIKLLCYAVLLGMLLAMMNMARPIAAVPIIALGIWLFVIDTKHIRERNILFKKGIYMGVIVAGYVLFSSLAQYYTTIRLGEEIATTPGYNIHVGFNEKNLGRWNEEDSALLIGYNEKAGWTANEVQKQMLEEAKDRIKDGNINFPKLFFDKFLVFLDDDSVAVEYANTVIDHKIRYITLCNMFYYFLIATSLFGALIAFKRRDKSLAFLICIYFIGLTLAQMIVEVAPRYHYSATLTMVILAALGICHTSKERTVN